MLELRLGHRAVGGGKASWAFVDASPDPDEPPPVVGEFDLGALLARIEHAVEERRTPSASRSTRSARCSRSSPTSRIVRARAVPHRAGAQARWASRSSSPPSAPTTTARSRGSASRSSSPTTSSSCATCSRTRSRRRTIEILKFRGTDHQKGECAVHDRRDERLVVIPLSAHGAEAEVVDRAHLVRQRRARRDVRRRLLPRLDHPRLRRDRHGQDADRHAVPARAASRPASAACCSRSRRAASSSSATPPAGASTSRRWSATGCSRRRDHYPDTRCRSRTTSSTCSRLIEEFKPHRVAVDSLSALERVSTLQGVPRVRHRPDLVHQAPGDPRPVHVDHAHRCWAARRSPRRTSRRSPTRSSCCATSRCSARCGAGSRC